MDDHNPFTIPQRGHLDSRPLCPWEHAEHEHYFAPVDKTEEAFQHFVNSVTEILMTPTRRFSVIATGAEGCGKTALLHRCARWMHDTLSAAEKSPTIIDLTPELMLGISSEAQLHHLCGRLIDRLAVLTLLDQAPQQQLDQKRDNPLIALPFLADILERNTRVLLVLLPRIELFSELKRFASLARPNLVLFTEARSDEIAHVLRAQSPASELSSLVHLEVGVLDVEDGWKFVEARLAALSAATGADTVPSVTKATLDKLMAERIRGRGSTTIRELQRTCTVVFSDVLARRTGIVEFADFESYYLRNGAV